MSLTTKKELERYKKEHKVRPKTKLTIRPKEESKKVKNNKGNYDRVEKLPNCTRYTLRNKLNRTDGPAIEYADGYKEWWVNGKLKRRKYPTKKKVKTK